MDDQTRIQTINRSRLALRSDANGEAVELRGEMLIGREVDCTIQLAHPQISRYHAKIYVSPNGVFLEDLRSSNGTYINGKQIHARSNLSVGDHVMFDDLGYRVTSVSIDSADQTLLSDSQTISSGNVEHINNIAANQLAPAPSTPRELEREKIKSDTPSEATEIPEQSGEGGNSKPKSKVHEIPDMEEFLRFAGSGLKPQEPLSEKANPFGLNKRGGDVNPKNEPPSQTRELEENHKRKIHDISQVDFPQSMPLESELEQQELLRPPSVSPKRALKPEDEDKTSYLSLNKIDQYVSTNEQFHGGLNIGNGPRLIALTAPIRGKVFHLESDDDVKCWSIGRDDSSDICIRDKAVSREHAWITKMEALFQLRVNDTANDILVNGKAVGEVELKHGDRLQLGTLAFDFRTDESLTQENAAANTQQESNGTSFFSKLFSIFK